MPTNIFGLILTCVIVVIVFSLLLFLIKRYKKCPSDVVIKRSLQRAVVLEPHIVVVQNEGEIGRASCRERVFA